MKTFLEFVNKSELNSLELTLDKLWSVLGIDIEFSRHFLDRVNDNRNKEPIKIQEIEKLFLDTFKKHGKHIAAMKDKDFEAVLNDIQTKLNVPVVLQWNSRSKQVELMSKTIMRKDNFKTPNTRLKV